MSLLNQVVEFCRVIASSVGTQNGAVLYNVAGIAGLATDEDGAITGTDDDMAAGEQAHEQDAYGVLGVIGRPLPAQGDAFAEALCFRTDDGLVPIGFRDLRLHRAINPEGGATTPREGQLMFAGYGGAFLSHAMTPANTGSRRGNISTLYVPYDFDDDGVPRKAHAISIQPDSISLVHGDGVFFSLTDDAGAGGPGIVWAIGDQSFGRISASEFLVNAPKITLRGNVYLGRTPEVGAPLLGGPISPPSNSIFISPA